MADIKYYDVILRPVVTEKSMNIMAEKKYTFMVHPDATKSQVKEAVEKMFEGTKVKSVNTMNIQGKTKRRGMTFGKTAKSKKAIVTLTEESKDIEIFQGLQAGSTWRARAEAKRGVSAEYAQVKRDNKQEVPEKMKYCR